MENFLSLLSYMEEVVADAEEQEMVETPSREVIMEDFETQWDACWLHGKAITAQFTSDAVLVYQAFQPTIGQYAVEHQNFVGCPQYNTTRMTWIKTNFTWMMYRNGWGRKKNQEMTLGIWLKREAFERYLLKSTLKGPEKGRGSVRVQWDPYHDLEGEPIKRRRAIQLGVKGVETFTNGEDIVAIIDMTPFVATHDKVKGPKEVLYPLPKALALALGAEQY
jgi:hypothetical protein